jgi:hypothetical protein
MAPSTLQGPVQPWSRFVETVISSAAANEAVLTSSRVQRSSAILGDRLWSCLAWAGALQARVTAPASRNLDT